MAERWDTGPTCTMRMGQKRGDAGAGRCWRRAIDGEQKGAVRGGAVEERGGGCRGLQVSSRLYLETDGFRSSRQTGENRSSKPACSDGQ